MEIDKFGAFKRKTSGFSEEAHLPTEKTLGKNFKWIPRMMWRVSALVSPTGWRKFEAPKAAIMVSLSRLTSYGPMHELAKVVCLLPLT
ncbi:hypothetical protein KIN20_017772 [Parelaphostrongylus tenuis]|uniref:Uncharacterized protein n=1 Tax=Parelaphostrongylus tenuis TaxID=148309 RepID=A0AAD5QRP4_PARTN|nr:hypothetical protein KIN20_017772 [Parelaphostrongylus tenuis]